MLHDSPMHRADSMSPPAPRARKLPFKTTALDRKTSSPAARNTKKQPASSPRVGSHHGATTESRPESRPESNPERNPEGRQTNVDATTAPKRDQTEEIVETNKDMPAKGASDAESDDSNDAIGLFRRSDDYFSRFVEESQRRREKQKQRKRKSSSAEKTASQATAATDESGSYELLAIKAEHGLDSDSDHHKNAKKQKLIRAAVASPDSAADMSPRQDTDDAPDNRSHEAEAAARPVVVHTPQAEGSGADALRNDATTTPTATITIDDDDPFTEPASQPKAPQQAVVPQDEFQQYIDKAMAQADGQDPNLKAQEEALSAYVHVTSRAPNASPFTAKLRLSNRMKLLRDQWCKVQRQNGTMGLPEGIEESIVLSWRSQRIYSYQTLYLLGIRPRHDAIDESTTTAAAAAAAASAILCHKDDDAVTGGAANPKDGFARKNRVVHVEAWTPDAWAEFERERERERRQRSANGLGVEDGTADIEDEDGAEDPQAAELRVVLRTRDLAELKVSARPTTTVETLVARFRQERGLGPQSQVLLLFDGERLAEHQTLEDADITDLDIIEVHLR